MKRQRETMDCLKNFRARVTAEHWLDDATLDAIDAEVLELDRRRRKDGQGRSAAA